MKMMKMRKKRKMMKMTMKRRRKKKKHLRRRRRPLPRLTQPSTPARRMPLMYLNSPSHRRGG